MSTTPVAYLPLVSMTPAVIFATGTTGIVETGGNGVNDTGSKFAGVADTGGKLPLVLCRWFRFAQLAKGKKSRP